MDDWQYRKGFSDGMLDTVRRFEEGKNAMARRSRIAISVGATSTILSWIVIVIVLALR